MCQPKRRALQKNEKRVQLGMYAFNQFYKLSAGAKKDKTYEEFCKSPYYNAFVKFGSFISNVRPLYPEKYIDYVVTSGVKLDHWCKEEMYEKYATNLIKKEGVETALERSVMTMMEWSEENEPAPWNHYFQHVSLNRAVWHIKDGKVSPLRNTEAYVDSLAFNRTFVIVNIAVPIFVTLNSLVVGLRNIQRSNSIVSVLNFILASPPLPYT